MPATREFTWQQISRAAGLTIVIAVLVVYVAGLKRDTNVTLAFLAVATGLLGLPSAFQIVRRNGGSSK